ncbi:MAG: DUF3108 domain-containing protein, partial [Myxococcota bacterium]
VNRFLLHPSGAFDFRIDVDQAGRRKVRTYHKPRTGQCAIRIQRRWWHPSKQRWSKPARQTKHLPKNTRDLLSALYLARTLPMHKGQRYRMHLYSVNRLWNVHARVLGKRRLFTLFGKTLAHHLSVKGCDTTRKKYCRQLDVWVSADASRVPLRIRSALPVVGAIRAELISYRQQFRSTKRHLSTRRRQSSWMSAPL